MGLRRLLAIVAGGTTGLVMGAGAMLATQGPEPIRADDPAGGAPAEQTVATEPLPEPSSNVLLVWTPTELDPTLAYETPGIDGVDTVSIVRGGLADLAASRDAEGIVVDQPEAGWFIPLDTVAFDPDVHSEFAPVADRPTLLDLDDGEALLSRSSATLRRLVPGDTLELAGGEVVTVAGIVQDTTIGAAELAVTVDTGAEIGIDQARYMLLTHSADRSDVEAALRDALPQGVRARIRTPGETPLLREDDVLLPPLRLKERFGEFSYQPPGEGHDEFAQEEAWQSENLVVREMPLVGRMRCHRDVVDAIEGALREIQSSGLEGLIDPEAFKGCWNPRLVRNGDDISRHAWGVALDLNYDDNPTGLESVQDERLVAVFDRWGFTWGGTWLKPDAGHFEFVGPPAGAGG
jgi:hypothetical protein